MNESSLKVMHDGVMITYDEGSNTWKFTLRGRDRSSESLANAKAVIDKPAPPSKAKPFEKISAWFFAYNSRPERAEITGIAERKLGQSDEVWINCNGKRRKERTAYAIYPANPKNDALVLHIIDKREQIEKLRKEAEDIKNRLQPLVLPKDEETE